MASFELYIIRHGIAVEQGQCPTDAERPLTEVGIKKTQKVAQRLAELGVKFDLIQTSPLVRAQQTAQILLDQGLGSHLIESVHLAPSGELQAWIAWLAEWRKPSTQQTLAIVGHQPNLGDWAEQLIWGQVSGSLVVKKAGVLGLNLPEGGSPLGRSNLFWLTPPKLLLT